MDLNLMTPYELGELKKKEGLSHLVVYLHAGSDNDKRLAASAIIKMALAGINCYSALPFLMKNLSNSKPQVRQYSLKALKEFNLPDKYYPSIKEIATNDEKEYNRALAKDLLISVGITIDELETDDTVTNKKHTTNYEETIEKGFVYFIREDYAGRIKIGKTKNMGQRWDTFNVKLPFNIELLHVIESQNHHYTEKLFHIYFDEKRVNGEWFELTEQDIEWVQSGVYTKRIMESLTSIHKTSTEKKLVLASEKQISFLSTLLNNRRALLMKPLRQLSIDEAAALISYLYRGENISEDTTRLVYFQETNSI